MSEDVVDKLVASIEKMRSTPEGRAAMKTRLSQWTKECKHNVASCQAAEQDILAVCKKHFPGTKMNLDAPEMLASAISYFDLNDRFEMAQLYLAWTVEAIVGNKLRMCAPDLLTIWKLLSDNNHFEDNRFEWNDLDNYLFAIRETPPGVKVWCATSQNTRYMFILDINETLEITDIHIRRYWDAVKPADDTWDVQDRAKYAELGFEYAIKQAEWLHEEYSDNLLGNQHVRRPDLQWWKDHDYKPLYGDCRDVGYVASLNLSIIPYGGRGRVDRAMYFMSDIKSVSLDISWAHKVLTEAYTPGDSNG